MLCPYGRYPIASISHSWACIHARWDDWILISPKDSLHWPRCPASPRPPATPSLRSLCATETVSPCIRTFPSSSTHRLMSPCCCRASSVQNAPPVLHCSFQFSTVRCRKRHNERASIRSRFLAASWIAPGGALTTPQRPTWFHRLQRLASSGPWPDLATVPSSCDSGHSMGGEGFVKGPADS